MAAYNPKQHVDARYHFNVASEGQLRRDAAAATSQKRVRFSTELLGPTPSRPHVDDYVKPHLVNKAPRPVCRPRTSTPTSQRDHRPIDTNDSTDEILLLCLIEEDYEKHMAARRKELSNKVQSQATASKPDGTGQTGETPGHWNRKYQYAENCCQGQCEGLTAEDLDIQHKRTVQQAYNQRYRKELAKQRLTATQHADGKQAKTATATDTSDNFNFVAHFVDHENHNIAKELARPNVTAPLAARSRHSAPFGPLDETYTWEEVIPHLYRRTLSRPQGGYRAPDAPRKPQRRPLQETVTEEADEENRMLQSQVEELQLRNKKIKEDMAYNDGLLVFYCNEIERRKGK